MHKTWKNLETGEKYAREGLNHLEQIVDRNMNVENAMEEGSERNLECIIRN